MSYLKTVLVYHQPSEAEVDKAFLESHGIAVCLLNGNTTRNELGSPFYIQLQVAEVDYENASRLIREYNPGRFGSVEKVAAIEKQIQTAVLGFIFGAIPIGMLAFFVIPRPAPQPTGDLRLEEAFQVPHDWRISGSAAAAVIGGIVAARWANRRFNVPDREPRAK